MRSFFITVLIGFIFLGCQENGNMHPFMLNGYKARTNEEPKSIRHNNVEENKVRVKMSEIDAKAKIEIAKIESTNKLKIAKINADMTTEVAHTDSKTKIKRSEIDALNKKEEIESQLIITIALIFLVMLSIVLLYLNNKKNRELKIRLQEEELLHQKELREREFEERRMHKMLELVAEGKLSTEMEEEIILALTKPQITTIEMIEGNK